MGLIVGLMLGVVTIFAFVALSIWLDHRAWLNSPEGRQWFEQERKEQERQEEWRRKVGKS